MGFSRTHSRFIVWMLFAATLFSAVSPGIAAAVMSDEPQALAQMLGIPAASERASTSDAGDHDAPGHGESHPKSHDGPPHQAHGIYCSFCLNASSTLTLVAPPVACLPPAAACTMACVEPQQFLPRVFQPLYRSRAPPFLT